MTTDQSPAIRYPDCEVELLGHDGNALAIVGTVRRALRRHLRTEGVSGPEAEAIAKEYADAALSGDYDNVLATTLQWVSVS